MGITISPVSSSCWVGLVVPIPTFPLSKTVTNGVSLELVVWKFMPVVVPAPLTDNFAKGEVVPMPIFPELKVVPVPSIPVPKIKFPIVIVLLFVAVGESMLYPMTMFVSPVVRLSPA